MPVEGGYQQQRGPAQAVGLPSASPDSFGAQIGGAVSQLGGTLHETKLRAYQLERRVTADRELSEGTLRLVQARQTLDTARDQARATAASGGAGHTEAMATAADAALANVAEGITDDAVRRQLTTQVAEYRGQFVGAEHAWQTVKAAASTTENAGNALDAMTAQTRTSTDATAYATNTRAWDALVGGLGNIDEDTRTKLLRQGHAGLAIAHAQNGIDTDPAKTIGLLRSGVYGDVLDGRQVDALIDQAEAKVRSNEAVERARVSADRATMRDQLGAVETTLTAGGGTYADRLQLADRYATLGDQSKAAEWRGKAAEFKASAGATGWTLPQLDQRIAALQAKQAGGGLDAGEAHELNGLVDRRRVTTSNLDQSGGALVQGSIATNRPIQPLDLSNPDSVAVRVSQARAAQRLYGRPTMEPLLASEMPGLKQLVAQGPAGKLQALDAIRAFGDPAAIWGAASQIAGAGDRDFRAAAALPHDVARDVLMGAEALRANPTLWAEGTNAKAQAVIADYHAVLSWMPQEYQADLWEAAKGIYLARAGRRGAGKWDADTSPLLFREALAAAVGRSVAANGTVRGGMVQMEHGRVLVPADMQPQAFAILLRRGASDADYVRASGGHHPRWADGSIMDRAQFNREMLPTALGGGRYGFKGPDQRLINDETGRTYTVDINVLRGR